MEIKTKEEYYNVYCLIENMEDMAWLSSKVESSLEDIADCKEKELISSALDSIYESYRSILKELNSYEEKNNIE